MMDGERNFVMVKNTLSAIAFTRCNILAKLGLCLMVSVKTVNFICKRLNSCLAAEFGLYILFYC